MTNHIDYPLRIGQQLRINLVYAEHPISNVSVRKGLGKMLANYSNMIDIQDHLTDFFLLFPPLIARFASV